ncbi:MAG: hypothetical protein NVSMB27_42630 [Ktedonobacteraceae bacterium]
MKKKALFISALLGMAVALLVAFLLHPLAAANAAASNGIHFSGTKTRQHVSPTSGGNLLYHGGPIMPNTTRAYAIFWEPSGSTVSATYNSLLSRYFGDVGGSGLYHVNTQYKDSHNRIPSGSVLGGSWVDTAAYPSNILIDSQIQQEVTHAQQVNGWTAALTHIFFVFTAKGENICFDSTYTQCSFTYFCAYHSAFGKNIYAAMPYTGTVLTACGVPTGKSPNNDIDADSTINVTSHEQMEAATDPHLNAWYDASGAENGDKCAWTFGSVAANGSNVTWNGHPYIVQREWDNAKSGCVLTGP